MPNEKLIVTTNDGTVIPVVMAPARCGAGVAVIIPNFARGSKMQTMTFKPQSLTGEQRAQYQALLALEPSELAELKALASK
jgi:hypothetical protein